MYEIIIVIDNKAVINIPLIIMNWKQFMKNNTIIFVFTNSYWLIIFTNDSISPFSIWKLPLGNMIKTLSDLGNNMKILLLLKVQSLHDNLSIFKHQCIWITGVTGVSDAAKRILSLFLNSEKIFDWVRVIY